MLSAPIRLHLPLTGLDCGASVGEDNEYIEN